MQQLPTGHLFKLFLELINTKKPQKVSNIIKLKYHVANPNTSVP